MAKTFVILDIETTGLNPHKDKVIEVAAIKTDDTFTIRYGYFHEYIQFDGVIPDFIEQLTGITEDTLSVKGKSEEKVFRELSLFIGDAVVIAHNAPFDLSFIEPAIGYSFDFIDTRSLAVLDNPYENPSLQPTLERLGLHRDGDNAHTAYGDVTSLLRLVGYFIDKYGRVGFTININRLLYTGRTLNYLPRKTRKIEITEVLGRDGYINVFERNDGYEGIDL